MNQDDQHDEFQQYPVWLFFYNHNNIPICCFGTHQFSLTNVIAMKDRLISRYPKFTEVVDDIDYDVLPSDIAKQMVSEFSGYEL